MPALVRAVLMLTLLGAGFAWLRPAPRRTSVVVPLFKECAAASGCRNVHTLPHLAPVFDNVMPWLCSLGAAASAADFDNDGDADLYLTNSALGGRSHLLRNRGDGTFEDVTERAGVACENRQGAVMHAIWGDVDNDCALDLYIVKWGAPNTLFRNTGDGRFLDITEIAGVGYQGYGNAAIFLDYDRDGRLDIMVGNYFAETVEDSRTGERVFNDLWNPVTTRVMHETFTHAANGGRNVLYRNRGDGAFEDVSQSVGLTHTGWTLSVGAGDLNNDGWPDLYFANDFGPDELYLSTGATEYPPRFRLVIDPRGHPGVGNDWWKGMNVNLGDVDNDGYLDIYVTNIMERHYKTDEGNMLWLNRQDAVLPGGRGFRNIGRDAGVQDGGWGWAGKFADFNNDGWLDIFTVNGFVTGDPRNTYWFALQEMVTQTKNQSANAADWPAMGNRDLSGHEPSRLFVQQPPGNDRKIHEPRFEEVAREAGIDDLLNGRAVAVADFNLDGALDIFIANEGAASCYYVNQASQTSPEKSHAFLRLKLRGRPDRAILQGERRLASTTGAVGARVTLEAAGLSQMREVQGGTSFASQSEYPVHFGVPDPSAVSGIRIQWPSGRVQQLDSRRAQELIGHHAEIEEGEAPRILR